MTIEVIVARYGLAAVFAGAAIEGETVAVAAGLLAHERLFALPAAMAAAAAGSFAADQLFFLLGRRFRGARWVEAARRKAGFARAMRALERHPIGFIFAFRFIYGIRTISPIAIGTSKVPARTFLIVNLAAAIVWGAAFPAIGYVFGHGLWLLLGRIRPKPHLVLIAVGIALALIACIQVIRWRRDRAAAS